MDIGLANKRVIVTGGSRGIGKAVARELALNGATVAVAAREQSALDRAASELSDEAGRTVIPVACDTASDQSVRQMITSVVEKLGGVDILINCAARPGGQTPPPDLSQLTAEDLWADVNVKVMGYLRCIREVAPHMARSGGGRIVNVSGLATRMTGSTIGSIRNAAVAALTKCLADELAPMGITLVVVHPGVTRTERTDGVIAERAQKMGATKAEVEHMMGSANLLGRLVDVKEVAFVIAFLASPHATVINGDAVVVGGGIPGAIHY